MKRPDISRLQKNRGIYFKIGFIAALLMVIFAFNYTTYIYEKESVTLEQIEDFDDVKVIPRIYEKPPVSLPAAVETFEKILENDPEFTNEPIIEKVETDIVFEPTDEPGFDGYKTQERATEEYWVELPDEKLIHLFTHNYKKRLKKLCYKYPDFIEKLGKQGYRFQDLERIVKEFNELTKMKQS